PSVATGERPAARRQEPAGGRVAQLVAAARSGDPRAVARLITLVESNGPEVVELAAALAPYTGRAEVIGLTGAPGVGKSTTTSEPVRVLRAQGQRVGVLRVGPSRPSTGGPSLRDRAPLQPHDTGPG